MGWSVGGPALLGDPGAGDPASVRAAALEYRERAWHMGERQVAVAKALTAAQTLEGEFATALQSFLAEAGPKFGVAAQGCEQIADILEMYATGIEDLGYVAVRVRADADEGFAQACSARAAVCGQVPQVELVSDSWAHLPPPSVVPSGTFGWGRWCSGVQEVEAAKANWAGLLQRREALNEETASRLSSVSLVQAITGAGGYTGIPTGAMASAVAGLWSGDGRLVTAAALAALPDAQAVRAVWDTLSPADRDRLIKADPMIMGNLNGVPLMYRAVANRANIRAEITRLQAQLDAGPVRGPGYDSFGLRANLSSYEDPEWAAESADLRNRIRLLENLLEDPEADHPRDVQRLWWFDGTKIKRYRRGQEVVVFDPSREAIGIYHGAYDEQGDVPAWMKNVVVHVPGTGTRIDNFSNPNNRATDMYEAANEHAPTAVIVWADGKLPQLLDAAYPSYARNMAPRLRDFTAAIDTHPASTLTVEGHSYGGTVVSTAESVGLRADRIMYVSSAGLGNGIAGIDEFPYTKDVPHYALMARHDSIVGYIQNVEAGSHLGHGTSPLNAPGVTRLETGWLDVNDRSKGHVDDTGPGKSHSTVYEKTSTSFENIVGVLVGGSVETWAPPYGQYSMNFFGLLEVSQPADGNDAPGYTPHYIEIE